MSPAMVLNLFKKRIYLKCLHKVIVPLSHIGLRGWIFDLVCPGNALSVTHEGLLLLKNATVNRDLDFDYVCKEKYVYVAFNQAEQFGMSGGDMVEYPKAYHPFYNVVYEWEIQREFFETNNIKPTWLYANQTWGLLNYTTGQWSGSVGMIQRDEVDYAICCFANTYARSKVAAFSPGQEYLPQHFLTRYPQELPPTWNLLGLFTKGYISQRIL